MSQDKKNYQVHDSTTNASIVQIDTDLREGKVTHGTGTVSTSATTLTIPEDAIGIKIYPETYDVYFATDEDPVASGTLASMVVGGVAKANLWEVRMLDPNATDVRLIAEQDTTTTVEFF